MVVLEIQEKKNQNIYIKEKEKPHNKTYSYIILSGHFFKNNDGCFLSSSILSRYFLSKMTDDGSSKIFFKKDFLSGYPLQR